MIVLDTDVLIFFLKGKKEISKNIIQIFQSSQRLGLSIISLAEIYEGIFSDEKQSQQKQKKLESFLKFVEILDFDKNAAQIFGKIRGVLRKKNKIIDNCDLMIASTCICNNFLFYTGNQKHFNQIPGLVLY